MEQHIAIYLRVSLEDFDLKKNQSKDESDSILGQRKLVNDYITNNSSLCEQPVTEFVDDGFTGTNFERPSFQEMLQKVKSGKISCIIVKDLSRFGRNYLEVGDYLEHLFPFLGIRFIAVNDNYDSDDFVGMNAGIDIAFKNILHDYYSRDLSVKVRTAQRSRMQTGKYVNVPPYGYIRDPKDKHHLIKNLQTAPIVRRIFEMIIGGSSTTEVAVQLNQEKVPTPLQSKNIERKNGGNNQKAIMWTHTAIINIIGNYKYTGAMVNHTRENRKMRDTAQRKVPQEEWIVNENMHEAIVTHEEYQLANKALRQVKPHTKKASDFTNCVYYCGHCGKRLRKTYGKSTYLSCQTFNYIPDAECKTIRWTLPEIERTVMESFKVQMYFLNMFKKNHVRKTGETKIGRNLSKEISRIKTNKDAIESRKIQLYTDYRMGRLSKDNFIKMKAVYLEDENRLNWELKKSHDAYEQYLEEKNKEDGKQQIIALYTPENNITPEDLLQLMYKGIEKVMVYKDQSLDIIWKFNDVFDHYGYGRKEDAVNMEESIYLCNEDKTKGGG